MAPQGATGGLLGRHWGGGQDGQSAMGPGQVGAQGPFLVEVTQGQAERVTHHRPSVLLLPGPSLSLGPRGIVQSSPGPQPRTMSQPIWAEGPA